jgi:aspartokinase/homoserine dehydrogenase 1
MQSNFSIIPKKRKIQPEVSSSSDVVVANSVISPKLNGNEQPPLVASEAPPGLFSVLKFGGSSVGSPERLSHVLDFITHTLNNNPDRRLAVVVSAQGNTTDWLLDGADYASNGDLTASESMINTVEETAITNAFAANSIPATVSFTAAAPLNSSSDAVGTMLDGGTRKKRARTSSSSSSSSSSVPPMPKGFVPQIRKLLEPLHKIMEGMSLLKERTPQGLDYALSFGERLSAFVLSNLLQARGIDAVYVDARSWLCTDCHFGNAKVDWEATVS